VVHYWVRCYGCGREWWIALEDTPEARHRLELARPHLRCLCSSGQLLVREQTPVPVDETWR
jgi:hypothetical protein